MKLTTYKNLQKISLIGVMVLIFAETISGNESRSVLYHRLQNGYFLQLRYEDVKTFDAIKTTNVLECAINCISRECKYFNYKAGDHSCQNFHVWKDQVLIKMSKSNENNEKSYVIYESDNWIQLYSFNARSGVYMYHAYIGKREDSYVPKECVQNSCSHFFRSCLIDVWEFLPIDQVKLVVYKNGKPAITLIFNGRNSTMTNWFSLERLISSPWNDLTPDNCAYFSIEGKGNNRRFYIARRHNKCQLDAGWLVSINSVITCHWGEAKMYPNIIFSTKSNGVVWQEERGVADSLAIFINLV